MFFTSNSTLTAVEFLTFALINFSFTVIQLSNHVNELVHHNEL